MTENTPRTKISKTSKNQQKLTVFSNENHTATQVKFLYLGKLAEKLKRKLKTHIYINPT